MSMGLRQAKILVACAAALLASACGRSNNSAEPIPATVNRFPVVVLSDGQPAHVVTRERFNDAAANPVQQFVRSYSFRAGVLSNSSPLSGSPTAMNFIASGRPEFSGNNDSLTADVTGNATAVWIGNNGGQLGVYANRYAPGIGWSAQALLATVADNETHRHRVAMDGVGGTLAAWTNSGQVWSSEHFNANWGALLRVDVDGALELADIAFSYPYGYAAWVTNGATRALRVRRYSQHAWDNAVDTIGVVNARDTARIAVHPNPTLGRVIAIWVVDGSNIGRGPLHFNIRNQDGTWRSPQGEPFAGSTGAATPQIAMSGNGVAMAVWEDVNGILASRLVGDAWEPVQFIGYGRMPQIAADAAGNFVMVSTYLDGRLEVNRYTHDAGWRAAQTIPGTRVVPGGMAEVAMDASGRAIAVWETANNATTQADDTIVVTRVIGNDPVASFTIEPAAPQLNQAIQLDGSASYGDSAIASFEWDFQSDSVIDATTATTSFTPTAVGSYVIRLRVIDANGLSATATQTIHIADPNPTPRVGPELSVFLEPSSLSSVLGTVSSSPIGILCGRMGTSCAQQFPFQTSVQLSASTDAPSHGFETFDCARGPEQQGARSIAFTLETDTPCTARYANDIERLHVTVGWDVGVGPAGRVISDTTSPPRSVDCIDDCDRPFTRGQRVMLRATADGRWHPYVFSGWQGCDVVDVDPLGGNRPLVCYVTMNRARNIGAFFSALHLGPGPDHLKVLAVAFPVGGGHAIVTDNRPPLERYRINECTPVSGQCKTVMDRDTSVILYVEPTGANVLQEHSGCDQFIPAIGGARAECHVTLNDDRLVTVRLENVNAPPTPVITRTPSGNVAANENVQFSATATTDDRQVATQLSYEWDFDNDGAYDATGITASHAYTTAGTYEVSLTAIDLSNARGTTRQTINVTSANQPPVASFTFSPANPTVGQSITFDASGSTDDAGIASYRWDFDGDGNFDATGLNARVTQFNYGVAGTFNVGLMVVDSGGLNHQITRAVTITQPTGGNATLTLTFTGAGHGVVTFTPSVPGCSKDDAPTCARQFPNNSNVVLRAFAYSSSTLGAWGPGCSSINSAGDECTIFMDGNRQITLPIN